MRDDFNHRKDVKPALGRLFVLQVIAETLSPLLLRPTHSTGCCASWATAGAASEATADGKAGKQIGFA
jgi:hypothetical protein